MHPDLIITKLSSLIARSKKMCVLFHRFVFFEFKAVENV